jgi:ABC-2 type transport system permease protein
MTLWQVIRREKRQCACDPRRFLFIFGAAIVYLLIFSVLFAPDIIRAVPTVLCDEDQSPLSRDLL